MCNWVLSYRVHGPTQVDSRFEIGDGVLLPRDERSGMTAELRYIAEAADKDEAESLSNSTYLTKAYAAVNALSLVFDQGLMLGERYEPRRQDSNAPRVTGGAPFAHGVGLSIANDVVDVVESASNSDQLVERSLRWYSLGLSTLNSEDRFVAFWTGLEASFKAESTLSDSLEPLYKEAKSKIDSIDVSNEDEGEFINKLKENMGSAKRENTSDSLSRILTDQTDLSQDELNSYPSLSDMVSARANIVHRGERVDDIEELAREARDILRELLDNQLDAVYDQVAPEGHTRAEEWSIHAPEPLMEAVFEDEIGKELSVIEIQKRLYGLTGDIRESVEMEQRIKNLSGRDGPLYRIDDLNYRYSPPPEWISLYGNAIITYLNGAGQVSAEVIAYNVNESLRTENKTIDVGQVKSECECLAEYYLVDINDGPYSYSITEDGSDYVEGKIDPHKMADTREREEN